MAPFDLIAKAHGMELVREYRFHPVRKWRADFAIPEHKILLEIEGGGYVYGRHHRPAGYRKDCEKYNEAVKLGWRVLRYTTDMLRDDPEAPVKDVKKIIEQEEIV